MKIPFPLEDRQLDYAFFDYIDKKTIRQFHDDLSARQYALQHNEVKRVYRISPKAPDQLGVLIFRFSSGRYSIEGAPV